MKRKSTIVAAWALMVWLALWVVNATAALPTPTESDSLDNAQSIAWNELGAKWNGSSWSALGSGIEDSTASLSALAVLGSHLYAGGSFSMAGAKVAAGSPRLASTVWPSPLRHPAAARSFSFPA